MLDQDAINYIEELVEEYMYDRRSFTSLDIANQAKERGHWARNHQVAEYLRSNAIRIAHANGYLYNQSLIRVDSKAVGMTLAYCYHHYQVSTDDYLDRDQNPKSFVRVVPKSTDITQPGGLATLHAATGRIPFDTREQARDYARTNPDYKVDDKGWSAGDDRWGCVLR